MSANNNPDRPLTTQEKLAMWAASGSETEALDAAERVRQARTQRQAANATEAVDTDRVQRLEEVPAVSRDESALAGHGSAGNQGSMDANSNPDRPLTRQEKLRMLAARRSRDGRRPVREYAIEMLKAGAFRSSERSIADRLNILEQHVSDNRVQIRHFEARIESLEAGAVVPPSQGNLQPEGNDEK